MLRRYFTTASNIKKNGIQTPRPLSPQLAHFMKRNDAAWTEVLKSVWVHIKSNNLQDPNQKRMIRPDSALSPFLGSETFEMFQMGPKLKRHILQKDTETQTGCSDSEASKNEWVIQGIRSGQQRVSFVNEEIQPKDPNSKKTHQTSDFQTNNIHRQMTKDDSHKEETT